VAEHIAGYLADLDTADRQEGEAAEARSGKLKDKIATLRAQMQALKAMETQVAAATDGQVSLTDPDARAMATSGRGSGMDGLEMLADRGYFSGEEIVACEAIGVTPCVPKPLTSGAKADGRFGKQDFAYVADQDVYRCPAGAFLPRAEAFRCRVIAGEGATQQVGSGCLIGPSLVLTAWHVVAAGSPDMNLPPNSPIKVKLSDGQERKVLSAAPYLSACTALEFASKFPKEEAAFVGHHDVAVLQLETADGARLGFAELPTACADLQAARDILVADFPEGQSVGWTQGQVRRIPNLTARMRHNARVAAGSSGGACFNYQCQLVGIHQGRWDPAKRLVPLAQFLAEIRDAVANDVAPPSVWSLDGTPTGGLVIGRDLFF
jgi:V8-like Glu-specific endopeptidase